MSELSTLERKPLSDLHQIASQLGIEQYRKYRKPQLAELIYKTATEQAGGQRVADEEAVVEAPETTNEVVVNGEATTNGAAQGRVEDSMGEADTTLAPAEEVTERRRQQQEKKRRDGRQDERQGQVQSGILDVLPDGFGFLRTNGYSQGKGDLYISTSQ